MRGVYFPKFVLMLKIISLLGPTRAPIKVKFGMLESTLDKTLGRFANAKFHPHQCSVCLLRGEKNLKSPPPE